MRFGVPGGFAIGVSPRNSGLGGLYLELSPYPAGAASANAVGQLSVRSWDIR